MTPEVLGYGVLAIAGGLVVLLRPGGVHRLASLFEPHAPDASDSDRVLLRLVGVVLVGAGILAVLYGLVS